MDNETSCDDGLANEWLLVLTDNRNYVIGDSFDTEWSHIAIESTIESRFDVSEETRPDLVFADVEKKDEIVFSFEELDFINTIYIFINILIFHSSFQKRWILTHNTQYRLTLSIFDSFSDKKMALCYVQSKIIQTFSTA